MSLERPLAQAFFSLTALAATSFAQPGKPCKVLLSDDHEIAVAVPDGTPASATPVSWTAEGMPLHDHTSRIRFSFAPWDKSSYTVVAVAHSGAELCRSLLTLPPPSTAVVPYADHLPPPTTATDPHPVIVSPPRAGGAAQGRTGSSASLSSLQEQQRAEVQREARQQSPGVGSTAAHSQTTDALNTTPHPEESDSTVRSNAPQSVNVQVFYATERQPLSSTPPNFGNQLNAGNQLTYGFAEVTVPATHKRLFIGDPTYWSYSGKDFTAGFSPAVSQDVFYTQLQQRLTFGGSDGKQLLLFIHGFNNGFEEDIFKTAELVYDTRFNGVPLMFDWPSKDGPLDYTADRTASGASIVTLADFLRTLGERSGHPVINIVAHSMGNRLLLEALDRLQQQDQLPHLGQVVMAAPDIDQARFEQIMPALIASNTIQRVTMYGSDKDMAMWLSKHANGAEPVGHMPPVPALSGVDAIDVSNVPMNVLGHDYFITTRPVLDDMSQLFASPGNAPPRHGLVQVMQGPYPYWEFPAGSN